MNILSDEIEQDINNFMKQLDRMNQNDMREVLRLLLAKHLHISNSTFYLRRGNLFSIINNAKSNFIGLPSEVYIDDFRRPLNVEEVRILAIVEATLGEIRSEKILGQPVVFNFKKR